MESLINTLNRREHEAEQQLNLSYPEKSLEKLKQKHNELTMLNQLLYQKIKELLKEDQLI
jgi:hypothetical protein